jgi:hypothetical protein
MSLKNTDDELELAIKILARLYYQATPVERYRNAQGFYEGAIVVDRNAIDYELWHLTGRHFGYVGLPQSKAEVDSWKIKP